MDGAEVEIELPASPASVARAREAVASAAARLGMGRARLDDLRTVVGEAFTNAVLYAYAEGVEGRVALAVGVERDVLRVSVRDFGSGIFPRPERDIPSLHMGLPIIGALSQEFRLVTRRGQGTEITVCMAMDAS
jgi:anti-sigma regulatory factor (Ser/Thr protein kinase)